MQVLRLAKEVARLRAAERDRATAEAQRLRVAYLAQEERYVLEGDRAALRDIRRQVDSLRAAAGHGAEAAGGSGSGVALAPAQAQQQQESAAPPAPGKLPPTAASVKEDARGDGSGPASQVDTAAALALPRFQSASGSAAALGLAAAAIAVGGRGPVAEAPAASASSNAPFLATGPPAFASSVQARAEAERLRRERRALLSGGVGDGRGTAAHYSASHPLVRQVDRLTVLAERQAASLQARGL